MVKVWTEVRVKVLTEVWTKVRAKGRTEVRV